MISILNWQSEIANEIDFSSLKKIYDVTYTLENKTDEREDWVDSYINKISKRITSVRYDPVEVILHIDNEEIKIREIIKYPIAYKKILVDATSLTLPELTYLFSIFDNNRKK